jgi:hypothetical protein
MQGINNHLQFHSQEQLRVVAKQPQLTAQIPQHQIFIGMNSSRLSDWTLEFTVYRRAQDGFSLLTQHRDAHSRGTDQSTAGIRPSVRRHRRSRRRRGRGGGGGGSRRSR